MVSEKQKQEARNVLAKEPKILITVDLGYGFTKVLSSYLASVMDDEMIAFPSAILTDVNLAMSTFSDEHDELVIEELMVELDGERYYVGERALNVLSSDATRTEHESRVEDEVSRVLFRTAIALGLPEEDGRFDNIHLVTGVPNRDYNDEYIEELTNFLKEEYTIKMYISDTKYIERTIKVDSVEIYRQPEGSHAFYQYNFGDVTNGQSLINKRPNYKRYVGFMDAGHVTLDYCFFLNGKLLEDNRYLGYLNGISEVYAELEHRLQDLLRDQGIKNVDIKEVDLDSAVFNGHIRRGMQDFTVSLLVEDSVNFVSKKLSNRLYKRWKSEYDNLEIVVATGGGMKLLDRAMFEDLRGLTKKSEPFIKLSHAQYGNVLGYYILGVQTLAEEIGEKAAYELYATNSVINNVELQDVEEKVLLPQEMVK